MSVSVKYKGNEIAKLTATGTKTLNTAGKYCEGNIIVENTESGGGGGGSTSETWVLNNTVDTSKKFTYSVSFVSIGITYSSISVDGVAAPGPSGVSYSLKYGDQTILTADSGGNFGESRQLHRKLIFSTQPTGDLLTWLTANGVKQPANLAVQPSKDVTVISNGTTEITPDMLYDVMKKAYVTVNVPTDADMRTINIIVDGQGVSDMADWVVDCFYGADVVSLNSGTLSGSISVPNRTTFAIATTPDVLMDVSGADEAIAFDVLGTSGSYAHLTDFPDSFIYVCDLNTTGGNSSFTLALSLRKNPNYL